MIKKDLSETEYDNPLSPFIFPSKAEHDRFFETFDEYEDKEGAFIFRNKEAYKRFYGIDNESAKNTETKKIPTNGIQDNIDMMEFETFNRDVIVTPKLYTEFTKKGTKKPIDGIVGKRITPLAALENILTTTPIKVLRNAAYVFDGSAYTYISPEHRDTLLMSKCRCEMDVVGTHSFLREVHSLLLCHPDVQIYEEDINENLISFEDGVYDLAKNQFYKADASVFSPNLINANYRCYNNFCPNFDNFLHRISGSDALLEKRIWEFVGYCISGDRKGKKLFVLQGVKNSGKSLFSDFLSRLFSRNTVSSTSIFTLDKPFALSNLIGKYLCISGDLPPTVINATIISILKQITGNDMINAAVKYLPAVDFKCKAAIILASNFPVRWSYPDPAFEERIVAIPFKYTITPDERDVNLLDKLLFEKDAVVNKALYHYRALKNNKYCFSGNYPLNDPSCFPITKSNLNNNLYSNLEEDLEIFLKKNLCLSDNGFIPMCDLYSRFLEEYYPLSTIVFSKNCYFISEELFGTQRHKRRVDGHSSPQHGLLGVKFK